VAYVLKTLLGPDCV